MNFSDFLKLKIWCVLDLIYKKEYVMSPFFLSLSLSFARDKYIDTYIERHIERVIMSTLQILFYNKVQGYRTNWGGDAIDVNLVWIIYLVSIKFSKLVNSFKNCRKIRKIQTQMYWVPRN